jgi:hypothetical protein
MYMKKIKNIILSAIFLLVGLLTLSNVALADPNVCGDGDDSHVHSAACVNKTYRVCDANCSAPGAWCNAASWTSKCNGHWCNDNGYSESVECCNNSDCPATGNECTYASCSGSAGGYKCSVQNYSASHSCNSGDGFCSGGSCLDYKELGGSCSQNSQCVGDNTVCSGGTCKCNSSVSTGGPFVSCNDLEGYPNGCECYTGDGTYRCEEHGFPVPINQCSLVLPPGPACEPTNSACADDKCPDESCWDGCHWIPGTKDCSMYPTVSLSISSSNVVPGETFVLTWVTGNEPDSCTASGDTAWTSTTPNSAGGTWSHSYTTEGLRTFSIYCSKAGMDSALSNVSVNVSTAIPSEIKEGWKEVAP